MTWVTNDCNKGEVPLPPFLRNKIAQTLVSVLQVRCCLSCSPPCLTNVPELVHIALIKSFN
mgnify:CR=1 FL=1